MGGSDPPVPSALPTLHVHALLHALIVYMLQLHITDVGYVQKCLAESPVDQTFYNKLTASLLCLIQSLPLEYHPGHLFGCSLRTPHHASLEAS